MDLGGHHLFVPNEMVAKEKAEAEALAASTAAAAASKGAKSKPPVAKATKPASGKDRAGDGGLTGPIWATDPASISISGDSEEGAAFYDLNKNRVHAARSGLLLDGQTPAATPASAKGKAPASESISDSEIAANSRQIVSSTRVYHLLREIVGTYKSLPVGAGESSSGPTYILDPLDPHDDAGWAYLDAKAGDDHGMTFLSSRLPRLLVQNALQASHAGFRQAALLDDQLKTSKFAAGRIALYQDLDLLSNISSMLLCAGVFRRADVTVACGQSKLVSDADDIEGTLAVAMECSAFLIKPFDLAGATTSLSQMTRLMMEHAS